MIWHGQLVYSKRCGRNPRTFAQMRAETEKDALARKLEDKNLFSLSNEKSLNEE